MVQSIEEKRAYWREYRRKERERTKAEEELLGKEEREWWCGQQDAAYMPTAEEIEEHCKRFREQKLASMPERSGTEPYVMHVYSLDVIRAAMEQ